MHLPSLDSFSSVLISSGGYTYCAISSLVMVDAKEGDVYDRQSLLKFLTSRQINLLEIEDDASNDVSESSYIDDMSQLICVGFNGRCNKVADTCYSWWIGATLKVIDLIPGFQMLPNKSSVTWIYRSGRCDCVNQVFAREDPALHWRLR
jgi:geranylgeranyl transferase type-1 subunit beta